MLQRLGIVTAGAAVFGIVELRLARHSPAEFWFGNSSAAWLLLAFVAGAAAVRWTEAMLAGLVATTVALAAFYLAAEHLDVAGLEFTRYKARWFALGAISGPAFGLLGLYWRRTAARWAAFAIAGPFCVEPLAWVWHRGHLPGPQEAWRAEVFVGCLLLGALLCRAPARAPVRVAELSAARPRRRDRRRRW